ncbi:hypothetical protein INT45_002597 [Circinella minor]|uniref:Uncharacterized protein n=1 Tax=Circinella minor TaxID=1195481 RepID=A0A8H7S3R6_9FUNG|nr:hypothetical protein INT45_002597 [Circinella minor]
MEYENIFSGPGHYDDQSGTVAGRHLVVHTAKGAASVSLFASVCVVLSYFFILWYQSSMANRISLRLIVFACLVNSIYNVMQLTVTSILDTSSSCRPAIYVVIATDIMCCMCLAMIGVNLVMILIVRINHPAKMEKYYYACIIVVTLLGILIPLAPNTSGSAPSGRMCCGLIIAKFARRQDLFGGTLDMASKGERFGNTEGITNYRRHVRPGQKTTVIFRKVILRCICYPLIPLICKGCGVGIEAAGIAVVYIPIGLLTADALLANLIENAGELGFFISCIYFTDPPVLAVIRELFGRAKRRYVDEYCSAQPLRKQQRPPQSSALFAQKHNDSLEQLSSWTPRRFFSADDVSTISKHSSRSDMSLHALALSPESSIYGNGSDLLSGVNTRILEKKAKALETVQGRTSVSVGIIANNTAKDKRKEKEDIDSPTEIVRSASTGRRYTHPHIDISDPHGRISERVSRIINSPKLMSSNTSTLSDSNDISGTGGKEEQEEEKREEEEEEKYYYYSFIRRIYQTCFPCLIAKDKKDEVLYTMPMHLVSGDQGIKRAAMESMSMNEMWALDAVQQHSTVRRGASVNSRRSHRAFNTVLGNTMSRELEKKGQSVQMVEPYPYPRLAMFIHWVLVNIFRVKPTVQQDSERSIELVDVTARNAPGHLEPIMRRPSQDIEHGYLHNQHHQLQVAQNVAEASRDGDRRANGNGVEDNDDDSNNFFKRSSIRAVSFSESNTDKPDINRSTPILRTFSNTSSQYEERFQHPNVDHENDDPKGKRPIMRRLRTREREPPFSSILPGKDNSSRKSVKSADGIQTSAEKFVVTVTDTGGDPTHQEVYPIHLEDKPTKENNNQQQHRPRIFRRVSDMSPQQWTKDKSLLQHVWGRGSSPSKSIKIAKQFAGRVGDTSIVKSMNNRYGSSSSPTSENNSENLSPPQSLQFPSSSPESSHSELYAQALDARPRHLAKKPIGKQSLNTVKLSATQFDPSTAETLMLDDFGMDHFVQPNSRPQPTEKERCVIDRAVESIYGFSSGATRVIYVHSWNQEGMNRVVVREEPWDYDIMILRALQQF